jgi:hypothetical protein
VVTRPRKKRSSSDACRPLVGYAQFVNDSLEQGVCGKGSSGTALLECAIFFLYFGGQSLLK